MAERPTVNREAVGSSPTSGAKWPTVRKGTAGVKLTAWKNGNLPNSQTGTKTHAQSEKKTSTG